MPCAAVRGGGILAAMAQVTALDERPDQEAPAPVPDAAQERALDFLHASALQHVVLADRKAGILFTLLSAALLYLFTRMPVSVWPPSPAAGLWLAVVVLLVAASALAFLVILPQVRRSGPEAVLFWGAVAEHAGPQAYLAAVCARSPAELARAKAAHCYQLSRICARKFRLLRWALIAAAAGLVLFLVTLAVGVSAGGPLPPIGG
jgi:hypothetical protein